MSTPTKIAQDSAADLYLALLKGSLTRSTFPERYRRLDVKKRTVRRALLMALRAALGSRGLELMRRVDVDPAAREEGRDEPPAAETMIGERRLESLQECIEQVLADEVAGDLIETGVWRGGACIFMRGVLKARHDTTRTVWVADSFQGLPKEDLKRYPGEVPGLWRAPHLAVSLEEVRANFERYGLLDEQVRFLPGWFQDTLAAAPIERLAVLRLDGDMYESTIVALEALYPKLSPGGFTIVDDYGAIPACRRAVDDYRAENGIKDELRRIDWTGVLWRRSS